MQSQTSPNPPSSTSAAGPNCTQFLHSDHLRATLYPGRVNFRMKVVSFIIMAVWNFSSKFYSSFPVSNTNFHDPLISFCFLFWVWLIFRALRNSMIWVISFVPDYFIFSVLVLIFFKWSWFQIDALCGITVAMDNLPVLHLCHLVFSVALCTEFHSEWFLISGFYAFTQTTWCECLMRLKTYGETLLKRTVNLISYFLFLIFLPLKLVMHIYHFEEIDAHSFIEDSEICFHFFNPFNYWITWIWSWSFSICYWSGFMISG